MMDKYAVSILQLRELYKALRSAFHEQTHNRKEIEAKKTLNAMNEVAINILKQI